MTGIIPWEQPLPDDPPIRVHARDLMVGNIVLHESPFFSGTLSSIHQVTGVFCDRVEHYKNDNVFDDYTSPYESIFGIPLDDEWLQRLGFVKAHYGYDYLMGGHFNLFYGPAKQFLSCYKENIASDLPIKSVHQLQNIYYALTGLELNYR